MHIIVKRISHRSINNIFETQQYSTTFYQRLLMKIPFFDIGVGHLNIIFKKRVLN